MLLRGNGSGTLEKTAHDHSRPRHSKRKYSLPCTNSKKVESSATWRLGATSVRRLAPFSPANRFCNLFRQFFLQRHQSNTNESRDADRVADFASLDAIDGIPEGHARNLQHLRFHPAARALRKVPTPGTPCCVHRTRCWKDPCPEFLSSIRRQGRIPRGVPAARIPERRRMRPAAFGNFPTIGAQRKPVLPHQNDIALFVDRHDARGLILEMNRPVHARARRQGPELRGDPRESNRFS